MCCKQPGAQDPVWSSKPCRWGIKITHHVTTAMGSALFQGNSRREYKSRISNRYLWAVHCAQNREEWSVQAPTTQWKVLPAWQFWPGTKLYEAVNLHHLYNHSTLKFLFHIKKIQNIRFLSSVLQKQEGFYNAAIVPLFKHGLPMQLMVVMDKADKAPLDLPLNPRYQAGKTECYTHWFRKTEHFYLVCHNYLIKLMIFLSACPIPSKSLASFPVWICPLLNWIHCSLCYYLCYVSFPFPGIKWPLRWSSCH